MPARTLRILDGLKGLLEQRPTLTVKQLHLILYVYQHPGCQRIELSQDLGITDGGITRMVNSLSKAPAWLADQGGLIVLTDEGRRHMDYAFDA